jgi:molybdopterin synthase catalytic subunit
MWWHFSHPLLAVKMTEIYTKIQEEDFDQGEQYAKLALNNQRDGSVVSFVGMVRDVNQGHNVTGLFLEHYPAMAEKSLQSLAELAANKWNLGRIRIIHRVGQLNLGDQIVFVGVSSVHRNEGFTATSYLMDQLKSTVPLWKKENTLNGQRWVEP